MLMREVRWDVNCFEEAEVYEMFSRSNPSKNGKIKLARGCYIATMERFFPAKDLAAIKIEMQSEDGRKRDRKKKGKRLQRF